MEAREEPRDPGYDDWFDEPELPTETQSGVNRGAYEDEDEVWVLPEEEDTHSAGQREFVIGGRTLTMTQVAIIGLCVLAVIFAFLAALGVFNGSKASAPPVPLPTQKITTVTVPATTAPSTPAAQAPAQTLSFGATGAQVKLLQKALVALGYSVTVDGDYGQSTQAAVQKFQADHNLQPDGTLGPLTLAALRNALAG
jgi:hypothetical protein